MSKVVKLEVSKEASLAIATLDDGSQHVLSITGPLEDFTREVTEDIQSGELAEYLEDVPAEFKDTDEDLAEAREQGTDWEVSFSAE